MRANSLQQWHALSDPTIDAPPYAISSLRRFGQLEQIEYAIPDEPSQLNFSHLHATQELASRTINTFNDVLTDKEMKLQRYTVIEATIIQAPPSTKDQAKLHNVEPYQTTKNKHSDFRIKIHVSTDAQSGLERALSATRTNTSDINQLPHVILDNDRTAFRSWGHATTTFKSQVRKIGAVWHAPGCLSHCQQLPPANRHQLVLQSLHVLKPCADLACFSQNPRPIPLHERAPQGDPGKHRPSILADWVNRSIYGEKNLDALIGGIYPPSSKTNDGCNSLSFLRKRPKTHSPKSPRTANLDSRSQLVN